MNRKKEKISTTREKYYITEIKRDYGELLIAILLFAFGALDMFIVELDDFFVFLWFLKSLAMGYFGGYHFAMFLNGEEVRREIKLTRVRQ